jgi:hypothetical protein
MNEYPRTSYPRTSPGTQPAYLHEPYRSTLRRAPRQPLISLPHTLSELTGPVYGHNLVVASPHPGITRARGDELEALRELHARTARAHGAAGGGE